MTVDNAAATPPAASTPPAPRRGPGHRGQDVRDAVAEMTARAHEISLEAGSKMAAAMKEVIHAAAGITQFATDSARDLVQFMVRRGQMTADEAEKLMKEAEEFAQKNRRTLKPAAKAAAAPARKHAAPTHAPHHAPHHAARPSKPAAGKKAASAKKGAGKKPAAKKSGARKPAKKK